MQSYAKTIRNTLCTQILAFGGIKKGCQPAALFMYDNLIIGNQRQLRLR